MKLLFLLGCTVLVSCCAAMDCQNRYAHSADRQCWTERVCRDGSRKLVSGTLAPCPVPAEVPK